MLYVGCKPDERLVRTLTGLPRKQIEHDLKGRFGVCKRLSGATDAQAMLDEDPGAERPAYRQKLQSSAREVGSSGLIKLSHKSRRNRIVLVRPKLEEWILEAARQAGVDPGAHGFPNDSNRLHGQVNANLDKFENLIYALIEVCSQNLLELKCLLTRQPRRRR